MTNTAQAEKAAMLSMGEMLLTLIEKWCTDTAKYIERTQGTAVADDLFPRLDVLRLGLRDALTTLEEDNS